MYFFSFQLFSTQCIAISKKKTKKTSKYKVILHYYITCNITYSHVIFTHNFPLRIYLCIHLNKNEFLTCHPRMNCAKHWWNWPLNKWVAKGMIWRKYSLLLFSQFHHHLLMGKDVAFALSQIKLNFPLPSEFVVLSVIESDSALLREKL